MPASLRRGLIYLQDLATLLTTFALTQVFHCSGSKPGGRKSHLGSKRVVWDYRLVCRIPRQLFPAIRSFINSLPSGVCLVRMSYLLYITYIAHSYIHTHAHEHAHTRTQLFVEKCHVTHIDNIIYVTHYRRNRDQSAESTASGSLIKESKKILFGHETRLRVCNVLLNTGRPFRGL